MKLSALCMTNTLSALVRRWSMRRKHESGMTNQAKMNLLFSLSVAQNDLKNYPISVCSDVSETATGKAEEFLGAVLQTDNERYIKEAANRDHDVGMTVLPSNCQLKLETCTTLKKKVLSHVLEECTPGIELGQIYGVTDVLKHITTTHSILVSPCQRRWRKLIWRTT